MRVPCAVERCIAAERAGGVSASGGEGDPEAPRLRQGVSVCVGVGVGVGVGVVSLSLWVCLCARAFVVCLCVRVARALSTAGDDCALVCVCVWRRGLLGVPEAAPDVAREVGCARLVPASGRGALTPCARAAASGPAPRRGPRVNMEFDRVVRDAIGACVWAGARALWCRACSRLSTAAPPPLSTPAGDLSYPVVRAAAETARKDPRFADDARVQVRGGVVARAGARGDDVRVCMQRLNFTSPWVYKFLRRTGLVLPKSATDSSV